MVNADDVGLVIPEGLERQEMLTRYAAVRGNGGGVPTRSKLRGIQGAAAV